MDKNQWISQFDRLILNPSTREFYGQQPFFNVGYWFPETQNQAEASCNLMEKLLEFIPEKQGMILDVGSGLGASTHYLSKYYPENAIVGINLSPNQIETSQSHFPHTKFQLMDATEMTFEDHTFDQVICVEAALYFNTRLKFLEEAWRVLKPGGQLILADISFLTTELLGTWTVPQENIVNNREDYQLLYQKAGFKSIQFVETTEECWFRHFRQMKFWLEAELNSKKIDEESYNFNVSAIDTLLNSSLITYWLVSAHKPMM